MSQFILSTDSTADLSMEYFQRRSVDVQFFHFTLGVNEYQDDCGKSVPPKELFRRMVAGEESPFGELPAAGGHHSRGVVCDAAASHSRTPRPVEVLRVFLDG
jgi:fatty acid-binding protein DegV